MIFNLIEGKPETILDASCGESTLINDLCEKYKPNICVGNDISWKTITLLDKNPAVFFTNHNVLNLPYKMEFDLVIFKNTLHHIGRKHQREVLHKLEKLTKQLIIIDIDDPRNSTLRSRAWNSYYVHLLGDQGGSFLALDEFRKMIVSGGSAGDKREIGVISTIKGKYFYASIVKNLACQNI